MTRASRVSTSNPRRRRHSAFTLIEALAVMMLLAIVLPVVMRGVSVALAAASNARHRAEAATLGSAKLEDLVASGEWSGTSNSGDFGPDYPGYQWSMQSAGQDFGITEVTLTVTWTERGQTRTFNISTLVSDVNQTSQDSGSTSSRGTTSPMPELGRDARTTDVAIAPLSGGGAS